MVTKTTSTAFRRDNARKRTPTHAHIHTWASTCTEPTRTHNPFHRRCYLKYESPLDVVINLVHTPFFIWRITKTLNRPKAR